MKVLNMISTLFPSAPSEIPPEKKYTVTSQLLGEGSQASVYLGYDQRGNKVAVKKFNSFVSSRFLESEISALRDNAKNSLKHSLKLLDTFQSNGSTFVVTPLVAGIELHQYVSDLEYLSEFRCKSIFYKVLLAVNELHKSGYCHLDLKLENIIYNRYTESVTLVDFGFSERIRDPLKSKFAPEIMLKKFCGSVHYVCPEIGRHEPYSGTKADVWSLGIMLYATMASEFPFDGETNHDIMTQVQQADVEWPAYFTSNLIDIISCMLNPDPQRRWNVSQLLSHPWFL